jgi:hypothetical protein
VENGKEYGTMSINWKEGVATVTTKSWEIESKPLVEYINQWNIRVEFNIKSKDGFLINS